MAVVGIGEQDCAALRRSRGWSRVTSGTASEQGRVWVDRKSALCEGEERWNIYIWSPGLWLRIKGPAIKEREMLNGPRRIAAPIGAPIPATGRSHFPPAPDPSTLAYSVGTLATPDYGRAPGSSASPRYRCLPSTRVGSASPRRIVMHIVRIPRPGIRHVRVNLIHGITAPVSTSRIHLPFSEKWIEISGFRHTYEGIDA